jgi:hypothetical protein
MTRYSITRMSNLVLSSSMHNQGCTHLLGSAGGFGGAMVNSEHAHSLAAHPAVTVQLINAILVRGHQTCNVLWGTESIAPMYDSVGDRRRRVYINEMVTSHVHRRSMF